MTMAHDLGGTPLPRLTARQAAVLREARLWLGTPYQHQGSARGIGADCLGLLRGIWRQLIGPEPLVRLDYTADWTAGDGALELQAALRPWLREKPVSWAAPGDVLVFRMRQAGPAKHLGIQAKIGRSASFIHSYSGHCVTESSLSTPWARRICGRFSFPETAG